MDVRVDLDVEHVIFPWGGADGGERPLVILDEQEGHDGVSVTALGYDSV